MKWRSFQPSGGLFFSVLLSMVILTVALCTLEAPLAAVRRPAKVPSASPRELLCNGTWEYRVLLVVDSCTPPPIIAQHVFWNCTRTVDRVLDDWATALSAHDTEAFLALFTDDCVYEDVTLGVVNRGREALRAFADGTFAAVPDFQVELKARFVAGNWAAMEWVMSGTHKGDFPGLPATGKRFSSIRGATVVELQGGKIRRNSDYWDAATFMRQVGLLSAP